jgi:hypothetical protein
MAEGDKKSPYAVDLDSSEPPKPIPLDGVDRFDDEDDKERMQKKGKRDRVMHKCSHCGFTKAMARRGPCRHCGEGNMVPQDDEEPSEGAIGAASVKQTEGEVINQGKEGSTPGVVAETPPVEKIKLRKVTLTRLKGKPEELITVEVPTYKEAEEVIRKWAKTAPEDMLGNRIGTHRVGIIIEWEDGFKYELSLALAKDLQGNFSFAVFLKDHCKMFRKSFKACSMILKKYVMV